MMMPVVLITSASNNFEVNCKGRKIQESIKNIRASIANIRYNTDEISGFLRKRFISISSPLESTR